MRETRSDRMNFCRCTYFQMTFAISATISSTSSEPAACSIRTSMGSLRAGMYPTSANTIAQRSDPSPLNNRNRPRSMPDIPATGPASRPTPGTNFE